MKLDENINYIASGLERSGTSMLMQILKSGELPVNYDNSRKPDDNNPKGYFELEGGKIINNLMAGNFPFNAYKGEFIKITAFGLQFLQPGKFKIIYSERNIEEILDSMEKMIGKKDENREETKKSFIKLNNMIKQQIQDRKDIDVLLVNYNNILKNPEENIKRIVSFLNISDDVIVKMMSAINNKLYRQRRV